ncbi:hypothetical protein U1Q18_004846 [Sarracenia purpurea var. burkii]
MSEIGAKWRRRTVDPPSGSNRDVRRSGSRRRRRKRRRIFDMRDLDAIDSNWEDLWTDCIGIFVRNNRTVREDSGMNVIGKGARNVPRNRGGRCHRRNGGESVGAGEEAFSSEGCMGFVWTEMAVGSQEGVFLT